MVVRPPLKGIARARGGARLVARGYRILSREAEEELFRWARALSEGAVHDGPEGARYFGSTMLTVPLDQLATAWRGPLDAAAVRALVDCVEGSVRVRLRALRIARAEAVQRAPGRVLGTVRADLRVSRVEGELRIDVDLEAPVALSSPARSRR
jgi:hypothetical protein